MDDILNQESRIRLVKEIPLTWVLGGAFGFLMTVAGLAWTQVSGQQRLSEQVVLLNSSVVELSSRVVQLTAQINGKDLKDVAHDIRLDDLTRRVTDNEQILRSLQKGHQ